MAASLESMMLGFEAVRWLSNVRRNLRENAAAYKVQAAVQGADLTKIAAVMTADATELLKTIAAVKDIASTPARRTKLTDYLTIFGVTLANANAAVTELENAAVALRDASKTTKAQIDAAADAVLSSVTSHDLPVRTA